MSEWLDEPDWGEFKHASLKCLILRHSELGHLCGYVGLPKGHPCYGKDYNHIPYDDLSPLEVHGGLTFSREGNGDKWSEGYWWVGFDCAHAFDIVPYMPFPVPVSGTYRNFQYVKCEIKGLADQLVTLEFIDWEFTWVWPLLLPRKTAHSIWNRKRQSANANRQEKPMIIERAKVSEKSNGIERAKS